MIFIAFLLYLVILGYILYVAHKGEIREFQLKEIVIEGLLSIQAGENPRVIEEKLKSFLAPKAREAISSEGGAA